MSAARGGNGVRFADLKTYPSAAKRRGATRTKGLTYVPALPRYRIAQEERLPMLAKTYVGTCARAHPRCAPRHRSADGRAR